MRSLKNRMVVWMEFEKEGIIFSNEYIPPGVRPFPKIDNYAQFLQKFQKIRDKVKWVIIEKKYDGTNLRLVKWGDRIYILTRNKNAENRFFELFKEALENNPYLIETISYILADLPEKSYAVGELISGKLKAPYTPITQPTNFIIYELWDNSNKAFISFDIDRQGLAGCWEEIQYKLSPSFFIGKNGKETMEFLSWLAWIRDYEGFVVKAVSHDGEILLRGKIKPIHFNYPTHEQFFYEKSAKKEKKKSKNENVATKEEVLEAIHKIKLKLSKEDFLNPKIAMREIAKEVKEEYNKSLPKSAYRLYLSVVEAEL